MKHWQKATKQEKYHACLDIVFYLTFTICIQSIHICIWEDVANFNVSKQVLEITQLSWDFSPLHKHSTQEKFPSKHVLESTQLSWGKENISPYPRHTITCPAKMHQNICWKLRVWAEIRKISFLSPRHTITVTHLMFTQSNNNSAKMLENHDLFLFWFLNCMLTKTPQKRWECWIIFSLSQAKLSRCVFSSVIFYQRHQLLQKKHCVRNEWCQ